MIRRFGMPALDHKVMAVALTLWLVYSFERSSVLSSCCLTCLLRAAGMSFLDSSSFSDIGRTLHSHSTLNGKAPWLCIHHCRCWFHTFERIFWWSGHRSDHQGGSCSLHCASLSHTFDRMHQTKIENLIS